MNSTEKALEKKKKHSHKKDTDGKCEVCNMDMSESKDLNEKGKKPRPEFGAKNNDSEED